MANFGRGAKAAKDAAKQMLPAFDRTNFLRLKDGESKVLRFIDDYDEWPYVGQHSNIPTKSAPEDYKAEGDRKWPTHMGAVCRKSKNEGEPVFPEFYDDGCFICDHMTGNKKTKNGRYYPSIRLWARAVVRDEILGTQADFEKGEIEDWEVGQPIGYQDHMIEVAKLDDEGKPTGDVERKPEIVVLNQSQTFFGKMEANALSYGSACERDYRITRVGDGLETEYNIVALDPIIEETESGRKRKWSLADPKIKEYYLGFAPDLEEVITDQASDEYYARFFDTRVEAPKREKAKGKVTEETDESGVGEQAAEQNDGDVATEVANFRQRLEQRTGKKPAAVAAGADDED